MAGPRSIRKGRRLGRACAVIACALALGHASHAAPVRADNRAPEIDRIEIEGVISLQSETVRSAIELTPGETVDRERIERARRNLMEIYASHGYPEAEVRAVARKMKGAEGRIETVLTLQVTEGRPTRIASIRANAVSATGARGQSATEKRRAEAISKIIEDTLPRSGMQVGDLYDVEKLSSVRRSLIDALAAHNYLSARVGDPVIRETAPPDGQENVPGIRWVVLELPVWPGDQIEFGFRGNTVFSLGRLNQFVEEQRTIGFGKDYVATVRGRIEDEYRALGYAQVSIQAVTTEDIAARRRHVSIRIDEGARVRLDTVDFDGNIHFKEKELREQFFAKASSALRQGYYVEKDAQRAAELVVEWMKSRGYLSAKLLTVNALPVQRRRAGDHSRSLRLVIYLYEWDQTAARSIRIDGASAIPANEIVSTLGVKEGEPLNLFRFSEGIEEIKARYRAMGYLNARIVNENSDQVVTYSAQNRNADIHLVISEGPQFRCGRILIEGLSFTKDDVVRREVRLKTGDILEESLVTESQAALRRLGIFSSVQLRLLDDPEHPDIKDISVVVQEGTPGIMAGGFGFRNDLGFRAFGGIGYTNIAGQGHTLALDGNVNRRLDESYCVKPGVPDSQCFVEYQAQLSYVWPWFLPGDTTFRPTLTSSNRIYRQFDSQSLSIAGSLEKKLLPSLTGILTASFENVRQFHAVQAIDNQSLNIGSITPALRLDLRDNPLSPTKGFYASGTFEIATPWLGSSGEGYPIGYTRFQMRADQFIPIWKDFVWYLSFRTGVVRSTIQAPEVPGSDGTSVSLGAIPLSKQFTLGGANSLRGYKDQELFTPTDVLIRGTQTFVNYRTQVDFPLTGSLKLGVFLDAANLLVNNYSFNEDLRAGTGIGLHYQTPVGPVNFDYGFKLPFGSGQELYFSIGVL